MNGVGSGLIGVMTLVVAMGAGARATDDPPAFDLDGVMRRAHFAFRAEGDGFGGGHTTYRAHVSRLGAVTITPYEGAIRGRPLTLESRLAHGDRSAPRVSIADDGSVAIARGPVVERLENTDSGLAQSWHFATAPRGRGDLVVRVAVDEPVVRDTPAGHVFGSDRLTLRYGRATWIDATGRRTAITPERVPGGLAMRVPASVVASSSFPAVLDPVITPIVSSPFEMDLPVSAPALDYQQQVTPIFAGGLWLVAWSDSRASLGPEIFATRVTTGGTVLDPNGLLVARDVFNNSPALATDGTTVLAVYERNVTNYVAAGDIYAARITAATGVVLDPDGLPIVTTAGDQLEPSVAYGGGRYFVTWTEQPYTPSARVYGARVSTAGAVLDVGGRRLSPTTHAASGAEVAFGSADFLVVWSANQNVYGTRVSGAGAVRDPNAITISGAFGIQNDPDVAWDGTDYQVVWTDGRVTSDYDVYGGRVTTGGALRDGSGFTIAGGPGTQSMAKVVNGGNQKLVVCTSYSGTSAFVRATRVKGKQVLDGAGITLAPGLRPHVDFGGTRFFVGWQGMSAGNVGTDAFGARMSAAGEVLDPGGKLLSKAANPQRYPHVVSDGSLFFALWHDLRAGGIQLLGARFDAAGDVLDEPVINVSGGPIVGTYVTEALAAGGGEFLAVWSDDRNGNSTADLFAARIRADGTVRDPGGFTVSAGPQRQLLPAASWAAGEWLVVWGDERFNPPNVYMGLDVFGARVREGASGAPLVLDPGGVPIADGPLYQERPVVTSLGDRFLVAWTELSYGSGIPHDVGAARVLAGVDGPPVTLDPGGTPLVAGPDAEAGPKLASDGDTALLVWAQKPSGGTLTIKASRVAEDAFGELELLDGAGISVASGPSNRWVHDIAFGGTGFLVLGAEETAPGSRTYSLRGYRLGDDGFGGLAAPDTGGFPIDGPSESRNASVAGLGDGTYAVVYDGFDARPDRQARRVFARIVDAP